MTLALNLWEYRADPLAVPTGSYENWVKAVTAAHPLDFREVHNDPVNWKPLRKPLSSCRVGLLTTGGFHLRNQPAFDIEAESGDYSVREIPSSTPSSDLVISHARYNHDDADEDPNVMFPIDRLKEAVESGVIAGISKTFFGMMGFIPDPTPLLDVVAPRIASRFVEEGADIVILAPG